MYVKPENSSGSPKLTPEFFNWLNNTIKEYKDVIEELAKK